MSNPSPTDALFRFRQQQASRFADQQCISLAGDSPAMKQVRNQIAAAAASGASVMIRGADPAQLREIAEAIHYRRHPDGQGALWTVDAEDALPNELSRVLQAMNRSQEPGTLLISSVDHLPAEQQVELLTASGRDDWSAPIVATQPDESQTEVVGISDELSALLSTIEIAVPPLAERPEDIPPLVELMLKELNREDDANVELAPDALDLLMIYVWPGELAELRHVVAKAHARCRGRVMTPQNLPRTLHHAVEHAAAAEDRPAPIDLDDYLGRVEAALVLRALELAGGNKAEAARLLGVSRPRLYRKLEQMGLVEPAAPRDKPTTEPTTAQEEPSAPDADEGIEFLPIDEEQ